VTLRKATKGYEEMNGLPTKILVATDGLQNAVAARSAAIYPHKQEGPEPRDAAPRPAGLRLREVLRGVDKLAQGGPARFEGTAIDCCHEGDELV
jgi:hypothetical protein